MGTHGAWSTGEKGQMAGGTGQTWPEARTQAREGVLATALKRCRVTKGPWTWAGGQSHCPHPPHARGVRATESAGAALPSTGHTRQSCLQTEGCRTSPSPSLRRTRRGLPRSLLSLAPVPSPPPPPGSWGASRRQAPPLATWPLVPQAQGRGGPKPRTELQQPEERGTEHAQAEPLLGAAIHTTLSLRYGHW